MGRRRLLQRYAEVPELSSRARADYLWSARGRRFAATADKSAELVSRPYHDRKVLGRRACLSPHRPNFDELCVARSAAPDRGGGVGSALGATRAQPSGTESRSCRNRNWPGIAGIASLVDAQQRAHPRWRRRCANPWYLAE